MKNTGIALLFSLIIFNPVFAQVSPPGLGYANNASWFALGLRQSLDSNEKKQSMTYVGIGRISNPDNNNLLYKPAIFVINQEFYNHYKKHFQYSFAISYRRSSLYEDAFPFGKSIPGAEQEFRLYGRYSYILNLGNIKWVSTLRQEFRKFYTPDFGPADEDFQLRSRLRSQITWSIAGRKEHKIIGSAEVLFSISKENKSLNKWRNFAYHESRFCLYYSFNPQQLPVIFDVGYMNNLLGTGSNIKSVSYLALDIIWLNPFGKPGSHKDKPVHHFE